MSHALNDDQVAGELRKMVDFIQKEAEEKAKEIELKANEEYEIEKANIVRAESANIDSQYAAKAKQESLAQQITKSTITNKARLRVLGARQEVLDQYYEAAGKQLQDASKDKSKYTKVIQGLVTEGAYTLLEPVIYVRARKDDQDIAKGTFDAVSKAYEEQTGSKVEVKLDEEVLPAESAGGVIIFNGTKKISVDNTLEERLKLLFVEKLPAIRTDIFGPSPTRKFFD
ncbi:V-type proton ATPase subunit E [Yarrowia sp. C11]|nr:V-type proton ATPase subunit E [Yarrowia sp. C11]KAG5364359.1 V-type proton ATPase subunit E [Yarrowia sp. E02]